MQLCTFPSQVRFAAYCAFVLSVYCIAWRWRVLSVAICSSRFVCACDSDPVLFVAFFSSVFAVAHLAVIVQLGFGALLVFVARHVIFFEFLLQQH